MEFSTDRPFGWQFGQSRLSKMQLTMAALHKTLDNQDVAFSELEAVQRPYLLI